MILTMTGHILILFFVAVNLCFGQDDAIACSSRNYGYDSTVCVCNATYCDEIPPLEKLESPYYQVYTSNKDGLRFSRSTGQFEEYDYPILDTKKIVVDKNDTYQTIFGWGGAFTDACTENIKSLDEAAQNKLLRSYFSSVGIEYNVGRVPIGGTDFSKRGYSYCDTETEDISLDNFKLQDEDNNFKIPVIQEALKITSDLKLFASAWIAPKWMKTNNLYNGFGRIKDDMYQVWANYYMKFFDAYKENNISFWGVTTGNEPSLALIGAKIPSNAWDENQMKRWIGDHLGPAIRNSEYKDMKILLLDDQRIFVPWFIEEVFDNTTVKDFVDMIAIHWYMDDVVLPAVLDMLHDKFPTKFAMNTEACVGDKPNETAVELGSWQRGERYASSIIEDIEHHFIGWIDWNMALDTEGGPSYINNNVDSPIIVNATAGEFYKQPLFYSMGHFSKFVPRGSLRIGMSKNLVGLAISATAFKRPDGGIVVVLQNKNDESHDVHLIDEAKGKISLTLDKHSLTTVVYY